MRFTSSSEVTGKGTTKVPLTFTMVNYISAKDLIEVRRLGGFRAEIGSADISAPADISAQKTVVLAFRKPCPWLVELRSKLWFGAATHGRR